MSRDLDFDLFLFLVFLRVKSFLQSLALTNAQAQPHDRKNSLNANTKPLSPICVYGEYGVQCVRGS